MKSILALFALFITTSSQALDFMEFCRMRATACYSAAATANWWDGQNLSALWLVNDGTGTNIAQTVGTVAGYAAASGTAWTTRNGYAGLQTDGTNGYWAVGDNFDLGTNSCMWSAWMWMDSAPSGNAGLISKNSGGAYEYLTFINSSRAPNISFRSGAGAQATSSGAAITTGVWHQVSLIMDRASGGFVFVDGALNCSITNRYDGLDFQSTAPLVFGSRLIATTYFRGVLGAAAVKYGCTTNCAVQLWEASRITYGR